MNAKDSEEDHRETLCAGKRIFDPNRHGAGEDYGTRHRAFSLAETTDFLGTQTQLGSQTRVGYAGWCTKRTEEC